MDRFPSLWIRQDQQDKWYQIPNRIVFCFVLIISLISIGFFSLTIETVITSPVITSGEQVSTICETWGYKDPETGICKLKTLCTSPAYPRQPYSEVLNQHIEDLRVAQVRFPVDLTCPQAAPHQ